MPYLLAAVEAGPEFPQPHYYLGTAYLRLRRINEARAELERTLEIDPHYPDAYFGMSVVYDALDMVPEQIRALERYRDSAPTSMSAADITARIEKLKHGQPTGS